MRTANLDVFDRTVQNTNVWLNEIMEELGQDRRLAWHVLTAVLHAVRERLEPDLIADLGTQLPMLVRGAYYDGYRPSDSSDTARSANEFLDRIKADLEFVSAVDLIEAVRVVCDVVARHVDTREMEEIWKALPKEVKSVARPRNKAKPPATETRRRSSPASEDGLSMNPRELAHHADEMWQRAIDDGMYGEAHSKTGKDAGIGGGVKKARPH